MNKLKSFEHLKQGDVLYHFEHGWENSFIFLMMCPGNDDVAFLQDCCGNPVALHRFEIEEMTSEWFEHCTRLQIAKYRMEYYEDMAIKFHKVFQSELDK